MICKKRYGTPIQTDAVIKNIPENDECIDFFQEERESGLDFIYQMREKDRIYGLGENVRGINKRGWIYTSNCSDDPSHTEDKQSLYGAHNFIIVDGRERFGVFIDTPGVISFDLGFSKPEEIRIHLEEASCDLYLIKGDSLKEIVHQFRTMIGMSYIPPKWAFGYGQSRWSYFNEEEVREVADRYHELGMPIDSIYLDIDYMEQYKDFTINEERFPHFPEFVQEMKQKGIHLVPIIDAGIKIKDGYDVYEEGKNNHYFCEKEDGTPFEAGVWPGMVHFPDVLNPEARKWFGMKYKGLMDAGIEGFWNDMNEPAIFFSKDRLSEVFEELKAYQNPDMEVHEFWRFKDLIFTLNNRTEDYQSFYHKIGSEKVRHDRVHNLYGYNMTRAAKEAFDVIAPKKRTLIFSRASYIGMHRYGGIWTGDNQSIWSHLLLNLKMMPSLNMCGFLYSGADLGGFGGNTSEDLMLRWLALGIFTPLMRNHSALCSRKQEAYQFEDKEVFRNLLNLRYALIPYLYSEFMKAVIRGEMLFQPLAFEYEKDEMAAQVEDQLLVGESIMIAPVYQQNATGRYVYLPEDMKLLRMKSPASYESVLLPAGHHYLTAELDEVLVFLRPDRMLLLADPEACVEQLDETRFHVISYRKNEVSYDLYQDDGITTEYTLTGRMIHFTETEQGISCDHDNITIIDMH